MEIKTRSAAVKAECKYCKDGKHVRCDSKACKLNSKTIIGLKTKIKLHCIDCVGERNAVSKCTGKLLNGNVCNLHPFRKGNNPFLVKTEEMVKAGKLLSEKSRGIACSKE